MKGPLTLNAGKSTIIRVATDTGKIREIHGQVNVRESQNLSRKFEILHHIFQHSSF